MNKRQFEFEERGDYITVRPRPVGGPPERCNALDGLREDLEIELMRRKCYKARQETRYSLGLTIAILAAMFLWGAFWGFGLGAAL